MRWSEQLEAEARKAARVWCEQLDLNKTDAEDVEQDCVLRVYELWSAGRLHRESGVWPVARGVAIDAVQRCQKRETLFCELAEVTVEVDLMALEVADLLSQFPDMEAVAWARLEGLEWEEMSLVMGIGMRPLEGRWARFVNAVKDVLAGLTALGGWSAAGGVAGPDDYHSADQPGLWLWASGARFTGLGWSYGVDVEVGSSAVPLFAQSLWDEVQVYGGAGNVWSASGDFGGQTLLRSAKHLRAQAWGILAGSSGAPAIGATARLRREDGADRGSGASDDLGVYRTGLPFGSGGMGHKVEAFGGETPEFEARNRRRHRRVLREVSSGGSVSVDSHATGMSVRAHVGSGGRVFVATRSAAGVYRTLDSGLTGSTICARFSLDNRLRIWLLVAGPGGLTEYWSDDLGGNWVMSQVVATGDVSHPAMAVHADGRRFIYWVDGGSVDGVVLDRTGQVLSTVSGARTGVTAAGLGAAVSNRPGGLVEVELVTIEDGDVVSSLSTDGLDFSA